MLYVKDPSSFAFLYNPDSWPELICGESFVFPVMPSIPPQLALIVKNVIRLKNKFGNFTKLVKLKVISPNVRADLLKKQKIYIAHIVYEVDEYLAPVNVFIRSKCCGIGHFRKQCVEVNVTCKTCGEIHNDLQNHQCSNVTKCIHCGGEHLSNSMKCPVVETFRDALTRSLLNNRNGVHYSHSTSNTSVTVNTQSISNKSQYSRVLNPWPNRDNDLDMKINTSLSQVNDTLKKFMIEKNSQDLKSVYDINVLKSSLSNLDSN